MPTYEYVCKKCGENFDVHQSFSDKPLKRHADCGGDLQKVFHARGIVFKGSGFYATDKKGKSSNGATAEPAKAAKKDDKSKAPSEKETKVSASSDKS